MLARIGWHLRYTLITSSEEATLEQKQAAGAPADGGRREEWLAAFDETLAGLSAHRPLAEIFGDILRQAARALDAPHGFLRVAPPDSPKAAARAGLGVWASAPPAALVDAVQASPTGVRLGKRESARSGVASAIAVPIHAGAQMAGVLALGREMGAPPFVERDKDLLVRFAQVAALASENERLFSTERAARQQESALRAATQALSATLDLPTVLEAILTELQNVVPHDTASVQELRGERMVIVGGRGIDMGGFLGFGFDAAGHGVPNGDVLRRRAPVIVPDILGPHEYPDFPHAAHALTGVRCWMGVPLMFGNRCTGMLTLDKLEPGFYTQAHAEAALAFAAQAAIALENARLYEDSQREVGERRRAEDGLRQANVQLQSQLSEIGALQEKLREQAIRDPLTGLFNRRYFTETVHRELSRARREDRPLALALLDVDHFKEINDAFGHDTGDRVLEALGAFLRERTRDGDVACRYGGEEFVILMPGAGGAEACARSEEWRAALRSFVVQHAGRDLHLTLSIGVADSPTHTQGADELIRIADVALYQAKREGRNRVVLAR
jgi:diguanylate cyclase (GGDEF)-like protein